MKEYSCQCCGGELLQKGDVYVCQHCRKRYTDTAVEKAYAQWEASLRNTLGEKIQEELIKRETEKFKPLLGQLWEKTQAKYTDSKAIVRICQQIKNIYPENFLANFYEVANSGTVQEVSDFLNGIDEKEDAVYISDVIEFMVKSLELGYVAPLNYLIERAYKDTDMQAFEHYCTKVEEEAHKLDAGTYNTNIPREVFVAYSSKDMQEVVKLVEEIESQGIKCFFAARNLRHGRGSKANYEREIEKALDNSKVIIFVSSKNSRRMDCVALKIELPYAKKKDVENTPAGLKRDYTKIPQKYKKLRIEYRLDNEKTPMADILLREFFAGLEYRKSLNDVLGLLAKYITDDVDEEETEEIVAKVREEEVEKRVAQRLAEYERQRKLSEEKARREAEEKARLREQYIARERAEEKARKETEEKTKQLERLNQLAEAQYERGLRYYNEQKYDEAVEQFQDAAERGNAKAQYKLGECYYRGEGVEQDKERAVEWWKQAAERGHVEAQNDLGGCYREGHGVAQNCKEAVKWYREAAKQGYAGAQNNLGICYYFGQGVAQNYEEAAKWYRKSAEQGLAAAQNGLGICYKKGHGLDQNYVEAVRWFQKAAEQGYARAQFNLGCCYEHGQGVAQNYEEAAKWYQKAAKNGHEAANKAYHSVFGKTEEGKKAIYWYKKANEQSTEAIENIQSHTASVKESTNFIEKLPFDWFVTSLNADERLEFEKLFILKQDQVFADLPDYVMGGDNKNFFISLFVNLGQYRNKISDGLMAKMYIQSTKIV